MQPRRCYSDRGKFSSKKLEWGISKSYKCKPTEKYYLFVHSLIEHLASIDYVGWMRPQESRSCGPVRSAGVVLTDVSMLHGDTTALCSLTPLNVTIAQVQE